MGLVLVSAASTPAWAKNTKLHKQFVASCLKSFSGSETASDPELQKKICECVADESKSQGATDAAIRKEAQSIEKDPKHKIEDQHVLNAFQYCAIEAFHRASEE